jgi:coenzyme F420-0:L-glutamate ligase / coenzyme F420-1:gamma-L-glutamate ligase
MSGGDVRVVGLRGLPELRPGDDLPALVLAAVERAGERLEDGDVVVVAQKAVSKVEGREVVLDAIEPGAEARAIAGPDGDPRHVQVVLSEAREIVRRRGAFLICETRHGFVCASAGVDRSNTSGPGRALLLPVDPDASARRLRDALRQATGAALAVVVTDSFGRPFRLGTTGVAIGCAGLQPLQVLTGQADSAGRILEHTAIHLADQLASAAELVMGAIGGVPAAVVRGVEWEPGDDGAASAVMPRERDLFR